MLYQKLTYYAQLIRLDRPIGIFLLLWPTLWALWFAADGFPPGLILVIFSLGVLIMRSAGCAINDFADRNIDGHVKRTKNRPLAAGKITVKEALSVFSVLGLIALILVLQLNALTLGMSLIALVLAISYPFMKRYHHLPQVHLGVAFGWSIPMAYTAITNELPPLSGWLVFFAALFWTTAYDTMYGITDRDDDLKIGVKSTAILFAGYNQPIILGLQILTYMCLITVGLLETMGASYFIGLLVSIGFVVYQHRLLSTGESQLALKAFLNNNWFGMVIFIGIMLDYWI